MKSLYKTIFKPIIDFTAAVFALLLLSPIFIMVAFALFVVNKGRLFFLQPRPGKNGKIFMIIKFKTMNDKKDEVGDLLSDSERLTKVGAFIRKASLDELPQLVNVLKGDMSLIGPRPLLPGYLALYDANQMRRHEVKPGITGWAQVNGRNAISWKEKFEFDVWYVENLSFILDLKIYFLTLKKVVQSEGITPDAATETAPFYGNDQKE